MDFDNQQKVRENPWPQRNREADGIIKIIAGVVFAIFGLWLFVSFTPFLFQLGDMLMSGYGANLIFQNHIYWISYILLLLAGIFLWGKQSSGYLIANGVFGFLLGMRLIAGLFYMVKYGHNIIDFTLGLIGIYFPLSIHTLIGLATTAGIVFCLVQLNRSHVREALSVDDKTWRMALLLGIGLLLYASFTMVFADFLFMPFM